MRQSRSVRGAARRCVDDPRHRPPSGSQQRHAHDEHGYRIGVKPHTVRAADVGADRQNVSPAAGTTSFASAFRAGATLEPVAGAPAPTEPGPQGGARYALLNIPEPVAAADADFNRGISLAEFRQAAVERFALLDRAHQGRISFQQLAAMRPALPVAGQKFKRPKEANDTRVGSPLPPGP